MVTGNSNLLIQLTCHMNVIHFVMTLPIMKHFIRHFYFATTLRNAGDSVLNRRTWQALSIMEGEDVPWTAECICSPVQQGKAGFCEHDVNTPEIWRCHDSRQQRVKVSLCWTPRNICRSRLTGNVNSIPCVALPKSWFCHVRMFNVGGYVLPTTYMCCYHGESAYISGVIERSSIMSTTLRLLKCSYNVLPVSIMNTWADAIEQPAYHQRVNARHEKCTLSYRKNAYIFTIDDQMNMRNDVGSL